MSRIASCKVTENIIMEVTEPTVTQDLTYLKAAAFNKPLAPTKLKIIPEHFLFG